MLNVFAAQLPWQNNSYVSFGTTADITLSRIGEGQLGIDADVVVDGDLSVTGEATFTTGA